MTYQEALAYLHQFTDYEQSPATAFAAERFDLRRMEALLELVGNPHLGRITVHIAGTKGKGSTAAMIAAVLQASGYQVGLFTSPHLCTFRERLRINGQPIQEDTFSDLVKELRSAVAAYHREPRWGLLTTFELTTALAFLAFQRADATAQVLEVGMGGRLDATNVVPKPDLCIITPISYDHTQVLGNTLTAIAGEKAGIIKPGVPLVIAPQPKEARTVFARRCYELNAPLLDVTRQAKCARIELDAERQGQWCSFRLQRSGYQLWLPLLGRVQIENAATAILGVETLRDRGVTIQYKAIEQGLAAVRWPGRLQVLQQEPLLVVDGAHNGASAARLQETLAEDFGYRRRILVIGVSSDKDIAAIAEALGPGAGHVIATCAQTPRAASPETVADAFSACQVAVETAQSVAEALERAKALAAHDDLICVTGSLFIVGEALHLLGLTETALTTFQPDSAPPEPTKALLGSVS